MADKKYMGSIQLSYSHSLLAGNLNPIMSMDKLVEMDKLEMREQDFEKFGFFDSASPNYTTYYPDVKPEELNPKDDEFIYPIFRALSAVVVHKKYNPVDFGKKGVLENSMHLLVGQSIMADHETSIGNAMGAVMEVVWEPAYKAKNGIMVPAGINARLKVDGKSNPRIARGIQMSPPSINCVSATVQFYWEKSHPKMSDEEFFSHLGGYDKEGKLITREATEIIRYLELSFVNQGADPYAQQVRDGKIVMPEHANRSYTMLSETQKKEQKHFSFSFKEDLVTLSENPTIPIENNNNDKNSPTMDELLIELAAELGITAAADGKVEKTAIIAKMKEIKGNQKAEGDAAEITRLKGIETKYNEGQAAMAEAVVNKTFRDNITTSLRADVTRLYNISCGNKPQETITKMIEAATYEVLLGLKTTYETQADADFPLTCTDCKSTKVSRASNGNGEKDDKNESTGKFKSFRRKPLVNRDDK